MTLSGLCGVEENAAKAAADADGGPKADDSDRLYDDLTRWRGLMQ